MRFIVSLCRDRMMVALLLVAVASAGCMRSPEAKSLAYIASGDLRHGVASLRKTLELNPKHTAAQLRLAQLMAGASDQGVLKDAQHRLQALLQDTSDNPDALHALALTELKLGDTAEAMRHLDMALAAAPQELMIAITLAQAKLQQKDAKGAEAVLVKARSEEHTSELQSLTNL